MRITKRKIGGTLSVLLDAENGETVVYIREMPDRDTVALTPAELRRIMGWLEWKLRTGAVTLEPLGRANTVQKDNNTGLTPLFDDYLGKI